MFTAYPTYNRYRTLELKTPMLRGEDVYALQTALNELGFHAGTADGILGSQTDSAIRGAQGNLGVLTDGKAGPLTQRAMALKLCERVGTVQRVPFLALKGQLQLESGFILGNYSPQRADGTYDAGVAQRNTKFTPPVQGFDAIDSIDELGSIVRKHYDLFVGIPTDRRRWALAQGAWNAPAYACALAMEEGATKVTRSMILHPSTAQRETFEEYVSNVSTYLT
jgi:hypothetical protein